MNDLEILIILVYYNRSNMMLNALNSIKNQTYKNWHLAFIDDGSMVPGAPIVKEVLSEYMQGPISGTRVREEKWSKETQGQVTLWRIDDTLEDKRKQEGTRHPEYMNRSILECVESPESPVIILCDDDALLPDYLSDLNEYYKSNPSTLHSFCHVIPFDPTKELPSEELASRASSFWLNKRGTIHPFNAIDGSQSTYRRKVFSELGVRYPSPAHRCLDASLHQQLVEKAGLCPFNGIIGQYKGIFANQLGQRNSGNEYDPTDLEKPPEDLFKD